MSPNRWEWLLDVAALIAAITGTVIVVSGGLWWVSPALLAGIAAVLVRRRFPTWAAGVAVAASGIVLWGPSVAVPVWVLAEVVLFTLAIRGSRARALGFAVAHATILYVGAVFVFHELPYEPVALILPVWTAAVVATGLALRSNRDYVRALEERTRAALAFRESEVARHVGEERMRIARDLHDSVAHTVSVISVHAGSAERQLETSPVGARASLALIRSSSRAVIDELQDILAVLRQGEASPAAPDVPGIEAVAALVDATRHAGTDVRAEIDDLLDLDRPVAVAAYRILQESLTNARKHGQGPVDVSVRVEGGSLHIDVTNDVRAGAGAGAGAGSGFGLLGMAQRAASVHGVCVAEAVDGRFAVRARLPLNAHSREGAAS